MLLFDIIPLIVLIIFWGLGIAFILVPKTMFKFFFMAYVNSNKVNSPERVDLENMHKFYDDIDVIMIASDMDGTPNQLLEAASVGRTFIGNRIGNVPEFHNGDNGIVVERHVWAYVKALNDLKENKKECYNMGRKARETVVDGWTWEIMAENYRQLFRSVL